MSILFVPCTLNVCVSVCVCVCGSDSDGFDEGFGQRLPESEVGNLIYILLIADCVRC
jgi:hypothetical protein